MFNSREELLNNFRLQKHLFTHKEDQVGNNKTHKQEGRHSFQETDFFTELNRMESKIWVYFTVQRIGVCLWYVIWNSYFSNSPGIRCCLCIIVMRPNGELCVKLEPFQQLFSLLHCVLFFSWLLLTLLSAVLRA